MKQNKWMFLFKDVVFLTFKTIDVSLIGNKIPCEHK